MAEVPGAVVAAAVVVVAAAAEKLRQAWPADSGSSERAALRVVAEFQAVVRVGPERCLAQAAEH